MTILPPDASRADDPDRTALTARVLPRRPPAADGRTALVDHSRGHRRRWSYAELVTAVVNLAAHLRDHGVREGDAVAVLAENSAEFVIAYHGVLAAGGVVLPLEPRGREEDWIAAATGRRARFAVVEAALWPYPPLPPSRVVHIGPAEHGAARWDDVIAGPRRTVPPVSGGDQPAVLMSSSGTQGRPKTVVVTHRNLVAGLALIDRVHRLREGEAVVAVGPLRHVYGMQMAMNAALCAGSPLVIGPARFEVTAFAALLAAERVAVAYLVPSVVAELGALPAPPPLPDLRMVVSGGAPLPTAAATAFTRAHGLPVVQGFGMTEAGCVSFTPDGERAPAGTVGVVLPGTEARFVDPGTGLDVPHGEAGELWLRGPQVAAGHLAPDTGDLVPLCDAQGWFRTGDLAAPDAGWLRITGRIKSMIKYKGHRIAPAELEDVLTGYPAVRAALVVGEPDPAAGELPKAYVVADQDVPLHDLAAFVAAKVPPHKRVRLVERVHEIPRSATGKPVRPPASRVIITGGGRGLGREFALALADAGMSVLVVGRDRVALEGTVELAADARGDVEVAVADVTDPAAVAAAFGPADVLVANAGVPGPLGPMWTVDADDWWHTQEVNLRGTHTTVRAVVPGMVDAGHGRVVTVVSRAGKRRWPHAGAYSVSKAALISYTANLDGELRGTGVTAVAFDPGLLDTGITRAHLDRGHVGDPWADKILDFTLRAREEGGFTPVEDAARALVRIATGSADHLAGRYVTVDDVETGAAGRRRADRGAPPSA
ncbi:SDR family NAD(P)-dependent oxidoreductase [Saccharothrix longispora]|uniref:Acyl-CoA synthetase (AMP-forming)/AMP-acid ligase II/NAD(P)-dependent dehydrogenase (Short-subunit alcohol dehydrogenase family) n=1 Tax=Saccharothrix longispora TaxID=33920 RepID=A0ABU1PUD1_9PSEU|nr:SDR family NAD(P)-dependent oxidoreductase [Saccharothrix longispora]MDR6594260.1 acyl-CoA synthetase (AMP-forming)/AMP-acid ligase II/NAD(P)-dependent dehydrogenase (short-subunit alcohol dehydrogenase family) [Saccharothrix longispora]